LINTLRRYPRLVHVGLGHHQLNDNYFRGAPTADQVDNVHSFTMYAEEFQVEEEQWGLAPFLKIFPNLGTLTIWAINYSPKFFYDASLPSYTHKITSLIIPPGLTSPDFKALLPAMKALTYLEVGFPIEERPMYHHRYSETITYSGFPDALLLMAQSKDVCPRLEHLQSNQTPWTPLALPALFEFFYARHKLGRPVLFTTKACTFTDYAMIGEKLPDMTKSSWPEVARVFRKTIESAAEDPEEVMEVMQALNKFWL